MTSVGRQNTARTPQPRRQTDARVKRVELYFLPVATRVPLKFGSETLTSVTCARVRVQLVDQRGRTAEGWGETPLSVQWSWPSALSHAERHAAMIEFCKQLAEAWWRYECWGHPLEIGDAFQRDVLDPLAAEFNRGREPAAYLPHLAALVCCSAFDIALHDAYGALHDVPIYQAYNADYMSRDLADFISPAPDSQIDFRHMYPADFLAAEPTRRLPVWHLVGGLDPLQRSELTGAEPHDGYPVLLGDWIERDGLFCLKVKLRGNDAAWDYDRLVQVGRIGSVNWRAVALGRLQLHRQRPGLRERNSRPPRARRAADLRRDSLRRAAVRLRPGGASNRCAKRGPTQAAVYGRERPHLAIRAARPFARLDGRRAQDVQNPNRRDSFALLGTAHNMALMVQDLTNPMLAQIPHVLLAAHAGTIMGVESNAMQFYPEASTLEARVHHGLYTRRGGELDLSTIAGPGFGYRVEEIARPLPKPATIVG